MTFVADQVVQCLGDLYIDLKGGAGVHTTFEEISGVNECGVQSLVFVDKGTEVPSRAAVVITSADFAEQISNPEFLVISVANVRLAQAKVKQALNDYDSEDAEWEQVHPSAVVHSSAQLGEGVKVGPNVVIGARVKVGAGTRIRANTVIEHDAIIGENCIINSLVNIGYQCELGDRVNIHSGVIIGNEGFGFAQDQNRDYHRIPHTGKVVLGNDVQVGANSNIDRGTYGATVLENGVKLDSMCHIAHNVRIKEGTLFASQACIAGSTTIGKRVMASGQVGILDHLEVADNVVLVHRSGVTENIKEPGMYAGVPAKPFKEYVRNLGVGRRLDKLAAKLKG